MEIERMKVTKENWKRFGEDECTCLKRVLTNEVVVKCDYCKNKKKK